VYDMSMIIPDAGKIPLAKVFSREQVDGTLTMKLFRNNYSVDKGTVLGDLTEANFTGYAAIDLTTPVTQPALDANDRSWILWDLLTWTKAGATGNTIYGYWVENALGDLLWAETFDTGGWAMTVDGTPLQLYPRFTLASQFDN